MQRAGDSRNQTQDLSAMSQLCLLTEYHLIHCHYQLKKAKLKIKIEGSYH